MELDQAVLKAYGWSDVQLDHDFHEVAYLPETDRTRFTISEEARLEILRRLAQLNRERYEEEQCAGLHEPKKPRPITPKPKGIPDVAPLESGPTAPRATQVSFLDMLGTPGKPSRGKALFPDESSDEDLPLAASGQDHTYGLRGGRGASGRTDGNTKDGILAWLKANPGWHGRAEILQATGLATDQWHSAIRALVSAGEVEREGEKNGARYRKGEG